MSEYYWCEVCAQPIRGKDISERHSTESGEDCHEACCPICPAEQAQVFSTI